jgi:hypothetical protein
MEQVRHDSFDLHVSELVSDGKRAAQSTVLNDRTASMRVAHRSKFGESCNHKSNETSIKLTTFRNVNVLPLDLNSQIETKVKVKCGGKAAKFPLYCAETMKL